MKKYLVILCALLFCAGTLFLQPVRLLKEGSTRIMIHVGKTIPLTAVLEYAGGYRCYINEEEYFWLSASNCSQAFGEPLRVEFSLRNPPILYRGEI